MTDRETTPYRLVQSEPGDPPYSVRAIHPDGSIHIFTSLALLPTQPGQYGLGNDTMMELAYGHVRKGISK